MQPNVLLNLPLVIAHRGTRHYAPENTLAAMQAAKAAGATWVEFDVMLAACGTPIVIHDDYLNRTTNGQGAVATTPYAVIKKLDAGSWFGASFAGEPVPTLAEMMVCLKDCQLGANIEIKPSPGQEIATALNALALLQQDWPKQLPPPLVSSFAIESLITLRQQDKTLLLGLLLDQWREDWLDIAQKLQCASLHLNVKLATPARINAINNSGRQVLVYTVNDIKQAKKLWSQGVAAVFSDYPDLLVKDD